MESATRQSAEAPPVFACLKRLSGGRSNSNRMRFMLQVAPWIVRNVPAELPARANCEISGVSIAMRAILGTPALEAYWSQGMGPDIVTRSGRTRQRADQPNDARMRKHAQGNPIH
jgi:hypothetical protein